jgi:hypothetical protein
VSRLTLDEARLLRGWCALCDEPHREGVRCHREGQTAPPPAKRVATSGGRQHEAALAEQLVAAGLPPPEREYVVEGPERQHGACGGSGWTTRATGRARCGQCRNTGRRRRQWRVDLAWPGRRLAVEVQGQVHAMHYQRDAAKLRELALTGWTVLPVTVAEVRDGTAARDVLAWWEAR